MDCLVKEKKVSVTTDQIHWRRLPPRFFGEAPRRNGQRREGSREKQKRAAETAGEGVRFVGE